MESLSIVDNDEIIGKGDAMLYLEILIPKDKECVIIPRIILKRCASLYSYDFHEIDDIKICFSEICNTIIENTENIDSEDLSISIKLLILSSKILVAIEADNIRNWDELLLEQNERFYFSMFLVKALMKNVFWQQAGDRGRLVMMKDKIN